MLVLKSFLSDITLPEALSISCHSAQVAPGGTFVAIKGYTRDGIDFIGKAVFNGARTIVVDRAATIPSLTEDLCRAHGVLIERVDDTRKALAVLSAQAWGHPALKLKLIGVTGTKGKTTSVFLLYHLLRHAGHRVALLSTVYNMINDVVFERQLTTPQPDYLHAFFATCVQHGVEYVVMEVAAQGLSCHRVEGLVFEGALFTNLSQEHAEFYASMEDYFAAKQQLFSQVAASGTVVINQDDLWGERLSALLAPSSRVVTFSCTGKQTVVNCTIIEATAARSFFSLTYQGRSHTVATSSLVGVFNIYNIMGVVSLLLSLGIEYEVIAQGLSTFGVVPGRMESYSLPNGARCFIDYAHTPSSFEAVLSTVHSLSDHLIVVFGAGGGRDRSKRPLMGAVAARYASLIILTSDNPRFEDVATIIADIQAGITTTDTPFLCIEDRCQAIKKAYELSHPNSVIMLLGKGPDEYEIVGDQKTHFSERAIITSLY